MLKIYNLMVEFLKYEFNNNLLGGVTSFKVTPGVTLNNVTLQYFLIECEF